MSYIRLETPTGVIMILLHRDSAPQTCRFVEHLVRSGTYDGCTFYRAEPSSLLQGGLRLIDGSRKSPPPPPWPPCESIQNRTRHVRGSVALSRLEEPTSACGDFFISLAPSPQFGAFGRSSWAAGFTVFGEVVEGMSVADRAAGAPASRRGGGVALLNHPLPFRATMVDTPPLAAPPITSSSCGNDPSPAHPSASVP
eukprot:TRINITY_DN10695_c0_g1_i1.p1 TRINITY_DN10695_c0_g1~~TRINITY_DN10695_c0_g1_i1.p1  ORF type:complete len:197 (-),score=10.31 TRINITY_DN10695_c0_g1_i1:120-710(-)